MNQRTANRRRHAAVLGRQSVKRCNGLRIAQHHGDLTTTRNAGGLALGACLWVGHSEQPKFTASHVGHDDHAFSADGQDCVLQDAGIAGVHGGGNCSGVIVVHGLLRSGPIPPMCEPYIVTSDVSTPFARTAA